MRAALVWGALAALIGVPLVLAAQSPLLQWRQPVYILGGFAGVVAMALMLVQPLLVAGWLPGFRGPPGRRLHRLTGLSLLGAVLVHVGALWVFSPPDVIDALTFTSPTPFSAWGVLAMWAVMASAVLALWRRRMGARRWRALHGGLVVVIVAGGVAHAVLIEGTMEWVSKLLLCAAVLAASAIALFKVWRRVPG